MERLRGQGKAAQLGRIQELRRAALAKAMAEAGRSRRASVPASVPAAPSPVGRLAVCLFTSPPPAGRALPRELLAVAAFTLRRYVLAPAARDFASSSLFVHTWFPPSVHRLLDAIHRPAASLHEPDPSAALGSWCTAPLPSSARKSTRFNFEPPSCGRTFASLTSLSRAVRLKAIHEAASGWRFDAVRALSLALIITT